MRISVVIPVLNEAASIGQCLVQFEGADGVEVLVVDGGSTDQTQAAVTASGIGRWIASPDAGRAAQMNFGARQASGEVLLFLHADTLLPEQGLTLIRQVMADAEVVGGRFQLGLSERTPAFRLIAFFSTLRSKYLGITYGDQAIFVRRVVFEAVGGYPPLKLFEDSEFCKAVARLGRFVMLNASVCSSTRRWRQWGIWRTVFWMWALRMLLVCSVSDERLSRWYRAVR